jgi:hypothetical protein
VVVSLCAPALAVGHADARGPAVCPEDLVGSAHPIDQFESVLPPVDSDHCPLCHWLRAVSGAVPRPAASAACPLDRSAGVSGLVERLPVHPSSTAHASRAPPAGV